MILPDDWKEFLDNPEFPARVEEEYKTHKIYPPREKLFAAFRLCPLANVKVVILGQDPYFNEGQAVGLSFSLPPLAERTTSIKFPPSLRNIIQEVKSEFGTCAAEDGDLTLWAKQGVLLLNTCLTVRAGEPLSHKNIGWEDFTRCVISKLADKGGIIFVLWGSHAQQYSDIIGRREPPCRLAAAHPSPLSADRGFFGCNHFKKVNDYLKTVGKTPIIW